MCCSDAEAARRLTLDKRMRMQAHCRAMYLLDITVNTGSEYTTADVGVTRISQGGSRIERLVGHGISRAVDAAVAYALEDAAKRLLDRHDVEKRRPEWAPLPDLGITKADIGRECTPDCTTCMAVPPEALGRPLLANEGITWEPMLCPSCHHEHGAIGDCGAMVPTQLGQAEERCGCQRPR